MAFSKWRRIPFFRLSKTTRQFCEFVGDLLDGESEWLQTQLPGETSAFEARSDIESILSRAISSRGSGSSKTSQVFASLREFYEAGFHLKRDNDGHWQVKGLFLFGRHFNPPEMMDAPFDPPRVKMRQVLRGRGLAVLQAFRLESLTQLRDSCAFLFGVDGDSLFLLLSDRPELWLEDHIVRTRAVLDAVIVERQRAEAMRSAFAETGVRVRDAGPSGQI